MTEYLMDPLGPVGTATRCPGCGSSHTTWVSAAARGNLLCKTCGVCWHMVSGHNEPVDVRECPGCEYQPICVAARGSAAAMPSVEGVAG